MAMMGPVIPRKQDLLIFPHWHAKQIPTFHLTKMPKKRFTATKLTPDYSWKTNTSSAGFVLFRWFFLEIGIPWEFIIIVASTIWGLYCHIRKFLHQVHGISRLSAWDQIGITSTFPSLASTAPNVGLKVLSAEMGIQALEAASMRFHVPRYSVPWCLSSKLGLVGKIRSYSWLDVLYMGVSFYMSFINVEGK